DPDALDLHAEPIRYDLRERRLVPLAVGVEPERDGHRAVRLDRHPRHVHVVEREAHPLRHLARPATGLEERAEADADVTALLAQLALPRPKLVVADELDRAPLRLGIAPAVVPATRRGDIRLVRDRVPEPELH